MSSTAAASPTHSDRGIQPRFFGNPINFLKHALTPYTKAEKAGLARTKWSLEQSSGFREEQSTQPQTLGYSLADSPVGLLAWIYEKMKNWAGDYQWTDDESEFMTPLCYAFCSSPLSSNLDINLLVLTCGSSCFS